MRVGRPGADPEIGHGHTVWWIFVHKNDKIVYATKKAKNEGKILKTSTNLAVFF